MKKSLCYDENDNTDSNYANVMLMKIIHLCPIILLELKPIPNSGMGCCFTVLSTNWVYLLELKFYNNLRI